ncbi:MAG: hypothetical protein M3P98_02290 [bacterium]|nr:hypothetical protein [bacterium]
MTRKKKKSPKDIKHVISSFWARSFWNKLFIVIVGVIFVSISSMYGIAQWYIDKHADEPVVLGASFIPSYARSFGLDEKETLRALLEDLGIRRIRLVSYWDIIEKDEGTFDFSELDWQYDMIEDYGGEVTLSIGLRQPRWPECHMPTWARYLAPSDWEPKLNNFLTETVNRYKDRRATISYQLENEFLLSAFGECDDHDIERLKREFALVKSLDSEKPLIVSRSNNATPSWPINEPLGDLNAASIYKRVWDGTVTKRYFEYPLPSWYYAFLAAGAEITTGRNTFIHELQAEAWAPISLQDASIEEQDKSLPADELYGRIEYAVDTGIKTLDIWGVEWWYWRKVNGDPNLWNEGKRAIEDLSGQTN